MDDLEVGVKNLGYLQFLSLTSSKSYYLVYFKTVRGKGRK